MEHKLNEEYTSEEIIKALRNMNMLKIENEGYIPTYKRTDLTDKLHEIFDFRTDTEIVQTKNIKQIIQQTKN